MCCAVQMNSGSSVENARPEKGKKQRRVAATMLDTESTSETARCVLRSPELVIAAASLL